MDICHDASACGKSSRTGEAAAAALDWKSKHKNDVPPEQGGTKTGDPLRLDRDER